MGTDPALSQAQSWWVIFFSFVYEMVLDLLQSIRSVLPNCWITRLGQGLLFLVVDSLNKRLALAQINDSVYRLQLANITRARAICYSDTSELPADENSFRFTPIKALRALPRLWERKPATPFKSGLKRKLWKRFQSSFSNMQTLESSTAIDHDALQTAINASKDSAYVRGVKRLCVGPGESADNASAELPQPGRPFLETKWESEVSRKRREYSAPDVLSLMPHTNR
jgi:hypothetical protein